MPLSDPASRQLIHTRAIRCYGYRREDGLWDIEGYMSDVKSYSFANQHRGEIKAGEPLHGMWLRLTLDMDFLIHDAEACTDWAPFKICPEIADRYKKLIGMRIGPGWNLKIKQLFNGVTGCTHLTDLLGPMATTAYQTMFNRREQHDKLKSGSKPPTILNSCHALADDSPVVELLWPQFHSGQKKATDA